MLEITILDEAGRRIDSFEEDPKVLEHIWSSSNSEVHIVIDDHRWAEFLDYEPYKGLVISLAEGHFHIIARGQIKRVYRDGDFTKIVLRGTLGTFYHPACNFSDEEEVHVE